MTLEDLEIQFMDALRRSMMERLKFEDLREPSWVKRPSADQIKLLKDQNGFENLIKFWTSPNRILLITEESIAFKAAMMVEIATRDGIDAALLWRLSFDDP